MKVKELIEKISEFPEDKEVVMYTPCGPALVDNVIFNGCDEVVLDSGKCCEHIMDGECKEDVLRQKMDEMRKELKEKFGNEVCTTLIGWMEDNNMDADGFADYILKKYLEEPEYFEELYDEYEKVDSIGRKDFGGEWDLAPKLAKIEFADLMEDAICGHNDNEKE